MRHGENEVRLQALHRNPPQKPTPLVVKPERRPAASVKRGQESFVRSSGIITLSARGPSDGSGRGLPQRRPASNEATMINHIGVTIVANRRIPVSHKYPPRGLEPGSIVTGNKWVVHWTSEAW